MILPVAHKANCVERNAAFYGRQFSPILSRSNVYIRLMMALWVFAVMFFLFAGATAFFLARRRNSNAHSAFYAVLGVATIGIFFGMPHAGDYGRNFLHLLVLLVVAAPLWVGGIIGSIAGVLRRDADDAKAPEP
jgi:hypothetical protein